MDQRPSEKQNEEPGADELAEMEADYAEELARNQAKKTPLRWKLLLWLSIALVIGAIQHYMIKQRTGETVDKLKSDLEVRMDRNASMFAQLRELKQQKDQGLINDEEYRRRRNQITGSQP